MAIKGIKSAGIVISVTLILAAVSLCVFWKDKETTTRVPKRQARPFEGSDSPSPSKDSSEPIVDHTASLELDELIKKTTSEIRPITWKRPVYSGKSSLTEEEQMEITQLANAYDENFQKIKEIAFHERDSIYPIGNSLWTQENVGNEGGMFSGETSYDITFKRSPTYFHMEGTNQRGGHIDLTVNPIGETGTPTQGESYRAYYMDGDEGLLDKGFLLECGTAIHHNVKMDITLPEIGNLRDKFDLENATYTVVETGVTDNWESRLEKKKHPNIPAKDTIWYNNRTGMPEFLIREISDETLSKEMPSYPYSQVKVIEYEEVNNVYYAKSINWIGKGYQMRRLKERTIHSFNGTSFENR